MALNFLSDGYFAGSLGIGTDGPGAKLDVSGDNGTAIRITIPQSSPAVGDVLSSFETFSNDTSGSVVPSVRTSISTIAEDVYARKLGLTLNTSGADGENLERVRVDGLGNVGIGTDSPTKRLEISESGNGNSVEAIFRMIGTNTTGSGSNVSEIVSRQVVDGASGESAMDLRVRDTADTFASPSTIMTLEGGGNVGIGTDSPSQKLEVVGNVTATTFLGNSTTQTAGDDSTKIATTAYVDSAVAGGPQGDITAVIAGNYLTGGGSSGSVTLNGDNTKLAHIVDSSDGSVTSGWITVAQASASRKAGEIYVTDGDSADHSFIRIDWMRSYADTNFTVLNCGGHANRITGVRVLQETADVTYGKKYLQIQVTATSNYYVIVTAPGTIPQYGDLIAETPVLEDTKTGYAVTGAQLEDLQNSSVGTHEGITVGEELYVNGTGDSYFLGNVGIGTTSPAQNFVVADATDGNGIELVPAGTGTIQAYNRGTSLYNTLNIDSLSNRIRSVNETVFNNGSGFSESMRILSGGNVGIGTTDPLGKLMVRDDTAGAPTRLIVSNGGTVQSGTSARVSFYEGITEKGYIERRIDGSGEIAFVTPADDNPFVWENPSGEIMRITNSNVGIGTTDPKSKLEVDGGVKIGDDTDAASVDKVGTMRYKTGTEYVEVTGTELVTNGDFATDSDWTKGTGWSIGGGVASCDGTQVAVTNLAQTVYSLGNTNITTLVVTVTSGTLSVFTGTSSSQLTITTSGTYTINQESNYSVVLYIQGNVNFIGTVDNVSVKEVTEEDASYADMCMQTGASTYEWVNIVRNTY